MDTSSSSTEAAATAPLTTIRNVDLKRYMGRWYEIANVPTRFQPQDSTNTTATYSLQDDGETVNVVNSTFLKAEDKDGNAKLGGSAGIKGIAYKKDVKEEDAKFKVRFWVPPFLPIIPITGDYWIIDLDEKEYSYAVVGEPRRNNLWILCRKPTIDDDLYDSIVSRAANKGYDITRLKRTTHLDVSDHEGTTTNASNQSATMQESQARLGKTVTEKCDTTLNSPPSVPENSDGGFWWLKGIFSWTTGKK